MKEIRWIAFIMASAIGAGLLCSCGESVDEGTAEVTTIQTATETSPAATKTVDGTTYATVTLAEGVTTKAHAEAPVNGTTYKKGYIPSNVQTAVVGTSESEASEKLINLYGKGINVYLDSNWTALSGTESDDIYLASVVSYPAIFQYKDNPANTCTIVVQDGCETAEAFAANDEESYIAAFGAEFDTLEITSFEFMDIEEVDSIKIIAKAEKNGVSFDMMHILSNNINKESTYSFILLDADGSITALFDNFEEKLYYQHTMSRDEIIRENLGEDLYNKIYDENGEVRDELRFNYEDYIH